MTIKLTLTSTEIAEIAARYGLDPSEPDVVENAEYAVSLAGKKCDRASWGTDEFGFNCAKRLLDGYLSQVVYERGGDDWSSAKFHYDAFGEE